MRELTKSRQWMLFSAALLLFMTTFPQMIMGQTDTLVVGSFNLEWLGHGNKIRSQSDITALAKYIAALEVDVFCFQEINPDGDVTGNGEADWDDLLKALGADFAARIGRTGGSQRLAILWKTDRVTLSDFGELEVIVREEVEGTDKKTFPRIPFTAYVKSNKGGVDFRLITAHLYFGDNKARYAEARELRDWLAGYLTAPVDKDVLLIGDFSTKSMDGKDFDASESQTIVNLEARNGFVSISKSHREFTIPLSEERYDHAFLSKDLFDEEYIAGSWDVRGEAYAVFPYRYLEHISTHCPVTLRIRDQDNDNDYEGDWGDDS
jgi:endonuclease/exonuclease/phosphatase family metal-dependent hydrolase